MDDGAMGFKGIEIGLGQGGRGENVDGISRVQVLEPLDVDEHTTGIAVGGSVEDVGEAAVVVRRRGSSQYSLLLSEGVL